MAARMRAGGPPRNTVAGSGWSRCFGHRVVEAAALADLPVHAGRARVVDLQAVHAEVGRALALGVLGVDEGQGDEGAAVLAPAGQDGQPVEAHVARHDLADRSRAHAPAHPRARAAEGRRARPKACRARGQELLGQRDQPAHQAPAVASRRPSPPAGPCRRGWCTRGMSAPRTFVKSRARAGPPRSRGGGSPPPRGACPRGRPPPRGRGRAGAGRGKRGGRGRGVRSSGLRARFCRRPTRIANGDARAARRRERAPAHRARARGEAHRARGHRGRPDRLRRRDARGASLALSPAGGCWPSGARASISGWCSTSGPSRSSTSA